MTKRNLPAASMIEEVLVTPAVAEAWLAKNSRNRNLRESHARSYAEDMAAGDWRWTGETIKFSATGELLDGQHRLRGVVIAGVPIRFLVVRGLDQEAQEDIDHGIPRKFHDVLTLRGEINASALAAIVRRVHAWNEGKRRNINTGGGHTTAQMLRTLEKHPELRDVAARANAFARHCDLPASVLGLSLWLFDGIDPDDSEFFFDRLCDGQGMLKGDPVYELRRTLETRRTARGERSQTYLLAVTIKAWNAYRNGDTVGLYRWRPGGSKPEQFPEPV